MTTGARVMLADETRSLSAYPQVGTIKISPSGYCVVLWDDGVRETYRPESLRVVTGEDAQPRHDWDCNYPGQEFCKVCRVGQTEANYLSGCSQRQAAGVPS